MRTRFLEPWVVVVCLVFALGRSAVGEVRTWTDATGKHKTEAEFVSCEGGKVTLKKTDGKSVTLPLTKLSAEDQAYVREQLAAGDADEAPADEPDDDAPDETRAADDDDASAGAAPNKAAAIKDVQAIAKRFYEDLRTESRDEARAAMTPKAQEAATGPKSTLALLPKPDDGARSIKVARPKIKDTSADVPVQVRSGGALIKTTLHLRFEDDAWRVFGISAELPDGEKTIDFETAPPAGGDGEGDPLAQLVGQPFALQGYTLDGAPIDIGQLKGKVVLVDFWATWCGPCRAEIPNILATYQKYHEQGFEVLAVSIDDDLKALQEFVAQENPPWAVIADKHPQNQMSMAGKYGVTGIPAFVLVGRDGNVAAVHCRGEGLAPAVEKALAAAAPEEPAKKKKK